MACDIDRNARKMYAHNYNMEPLSDIKSIDASQIEPYDLLCAGFPCQAFSSMGKKLGFADPASGDLFMEIMRFVAANRPPMVLLENVYALLTHDRGVTFETIKSLLRGEGYVVHHCVAMLSDFGIPQMRKRVFVIAVRESMGVSTAQLERFFDWEEFKHVVTLSEFFQADFERVFARTIRRSGRYSKIGDEHNWSQFIRNGEVYTLSIEDVCRLQAIPEIKLTGSETQQWFLIGNTIPGTFTRMLGIRLKELWSELSVVRGEG